MESKRQKKLSSRRSNLCKKFTIARSGMPNSIELMKRDDPDPLEVSDEPLDPKTKAGCRNFAFLVSSIVFSIGVSSAVWGWTAFSDTARAVEFRDWIVNHWRLLLVVVVLTSVPGMAKQIAAHLRIAYQNKYPDDMNLGADKWFSERLDQLRLNQDVARGPLKSVFGFINAYDPRRDPVILSYTVKDKETPIAWAIAAHELGHIVVHRKNPGWSALNLFNRSVLHFLTNVLPIWLLFSAFFATPLTVKIVFGALIVATSVGALVCIDDVLASRVAMREMRAEQKVSEPALMDIRRLLFAMFLTHGAPVIALATTLMFWAPLETLLLSGSFEVASPLAGTARIMTMILGAVLIALSLFNISKLTMKAEPSTFGFKLIHKWALIGLTFAFVFLTWDSSDTPLFVVAVFLAASLLHQVVTLLMVPWDVLKFPISFLLVLVHLFSEKIASKKSKAPTKTRNSYRFDDPDSIITHYTFSVLSNLAVVPVVVLWFLASI